MASFISSVAGALVNEFVRAVEPDVSARERHKFAERFKDWASDYRSYSIVVLAVGTITALGAVLAAPIASVVILGVTAAGVYFTESMAKYFDKMKKIFQEPSNFVCRPGQSPQDLIDHLAYEKGTENLPFFVRSYVETFLH